MSFVKLQEQDDSSQLTHDKNSIELSPLYSTIPQTASNAPIVEKTPASEIPTALTNKQEPVWPGILFMIGIAIFSAALVVGICATVDYVPKKDWNDHALATNCSIDGRYIARSYGKRYVTFNGYITVSYRTIYNTNYRRDIIVYRDDYEMSITDKFVNSYPVPSIIECYYSKRNPSAEIKLQLEYVKLDIIGMFICYSIIGAICVIPCGILFVILCIDLLLCPKR